MQTNSFMCLSPLAKPTFHWKHVVNHHLCRNWIQTLRSLFWALVLFLFSEIPSVSPETSRPAQPWKGTGGLLAGKCPLSSYRAGVWGCPPLNSHSTQGWLPLGNTGEHQQLGGHKWPVWSRLNSPCDYMGGRGWGGAGLTASGPAGGAGTERWEWFWYRPWPSSRTDARWCAWASGSSFTSVHHYHQIIVYHTLIYKYSITLTQYNILCHMSLRVYYVSL